MTDQVNETEQLEIAQKLNAMEMGDDGPMIDIPENSAETQSQAVDVPTEEEKNSEETKTDTQQVENVSVKKDHRAQMSFPYSHPVDWKDDETVVVLPSDFDKETRKALEGIPNIDLLSDPVTRGWAGIVSEGLEVSTFDETFVPTLEQENAEFGQCVDVNGAKLMGGRPKWNNADNQNLKGERSTILLMSHLGYGTLFQTPLWHSGLWITFKAPTDSEIIELNRIIAADKIEFGRYSYGVAFSNISSYMTDRLLDFALSHVYDTTLRREDFPENGLKSIILSQDYPSLLWGLICSMYPRGFQYTRACVNEPDKCNNVIRELLNVTKLQWVNRRPLTDWQRTHMSSRQAKSKDLASIKRYQEELTTIQKRVVVFNEGTPSEIRMTLKTPTLEEYVDAGHRWIGDIVNMVDRVLGLQENDVERNNYIKRHGQASSMRQYIHWVKSIELGTNIIDDIESIEQNFNQLSAVDSIRDGFMEHITDYINASSMAVIGIPVFDCPVCGKTQDTPLKDSEYKNIIPLDVVQLFFALITQRLGKIAIR